METKEDFILVDINKCRGCGNCLIVCPLNEIIDIDTQYGKKTKNVLFKVVNGAIDRKEICYECSDAPCIEACDKGILKKDENGLVYLDLDIDMENISESDIEKFKICDECDKKCIEACPSGELFLTTIKSDGKIFSVPIKCDTCDGDPQCVKVCPANAIKYINISKESYENKKKHAEIIAKVSKLIS
jgi:Fe-S-cluster-containing hydrogenase component 2